MLLSTRPVMLMIGVVEVTLPAFGVTTGFVNPTNAGVYQDTVNARCVFGFNPNTQRALTVSWYTPAFVGFTNPVVTPNAGNVTSTTPIINITGLVDSNIAVNAFYASLTGCPALTGDDFDFILYNVVDGQDVVSISAKTG